MSNFEEIKFPADKLAECKNILCDCGNYIWIPGIVLKMIPGLMIGRSAPGITPLNILFCSECKKLHPDHEKQIGDINKPLILPD